jgi:hypothetical protein
MRSAPRQPTPIRERVSLLRNVTFLHGSLTCVLLVLLPEPHAVLKALRAPVPAARPYAACRNGSRKIQVATQAQRPTSSASPVNANGGNAAMPIGPFVGDCVFDPEQIAAMSRAFESLCRELELPDRNGAIAEMVARHIVNAAKRGMRSKTALYLDAKVEFMSHQQ